ncbi:MAG: hypothetical protein Q7S48_00115, partial [bacterium]|nr:hypothetical protein [bacterium]
CGHASMQGDIVPTLCQAAAHTKSAHGFFGIRYKIAGLFRPFLFATKPKREYFLFTMYKKTQTMSQMRFI